MDTGSIIALTWFVVALIIVFASFAIDDWQMGDDPTAELIPFVFAAIWPMLLALTVMAIPFFLAATLGKLVKHKTQQLGNSE